MTNKIDVTHTDVPMQNDGHRFMAVIYVDKMLKGRTMVATYYTPANENKVNFISRIFSEITQIINRNSPKYVIITSDSNIHRDDKERNSTKETMRILENICLRDAYRHLHEDPLTFPGYTFPARENTKNNHTRIDYIMGSKNIFEEDAKINIIPKYLLGSDHNGITMQFCKSERIKSKYRLKNYMLANP